MFLFWSFSHGGISFFYSSNKNKEKLNLEIKKDEFEEIQAKIYDEESCSEIYEIVKEILVPENFIDFNFLMKISIYVENYNIFSTVFSV